MTSRSGEHFCTFQTICPLLAIKHLFYGSNLFVGHLPCHGDFFVVRYTERSVGVGGDDGTFPIEGILKTINSENHKQKHVNDILTMNIKYLKYNFKVSTMYLDTPKVVLIYLFDTLLVDLVSDIKL